MTDCAFADKDIFPLITTPKGASTVDYEGSHTVAAAIGTFPGYCYHNAWRACRECPLHDAALVEEWLMLETLTWMLVLEHAWVECAGGNIIDPSLVQLLSRAQLSLATYFPGVRYLCFHLQRVLCGELPLVHIHGGLAVPGYAHAYQSALAEASTSAHVLNRPGQVQVVPAAQSDIAGESLSLLLSLLLSAEERRPLA